MPTDIQKFLEELLAPVIDFLKQEGAWDSLSSFYQTASGVFSKLFFWVQSSISFKGIINFFIALFKLVIQIIMAFIDVFRDIFQWIGEVFK